MFQLGQPVQRDRDVDGADDHKMSGPAKRFDEPIAIAACELRARRRPFRDGGLAGDEVGAQRRRAVLVQELDQLLVDRGERLNENFDVPAAGEPHRKCHVVGDPEGSDLRLACLQHLLRFLEHRAFDASVGDRARHLSRSRHHHLRTERTRAGSPCLDDSGQRDLLLVLGPGLQLAQDFAHEPVSASVSAGRRGRPASFRGRRAPGRYERPGSHRSKAARRPCRE